MSSVQTCFPLSHLKWKPLAGERTTIYWWSNNSEVIHRINFRFIWLTSTLFQFCILNFPFLKMTFFSSIWIIYMHQSTFHSTTYFFHSSFKYNILSGIRFQLCNKMSSVNFCLSIAFLVIVPFLYHHLIHLISV